MSSTISVKFLSAWYRAFLELGTSKTAAAAAIEAENGRVETGFPLGTSFVDAGDDLTCSCHDSNSHHFCLLPWTTAVFLDHNVS